MLYAVRKSIKPLANVDFDKLISKISQNVHPLADLSQTETRIILLLQLRTVVTAVPELAHTLSTANVGLLRHLEEVRQGSSTVADSIRTSPATLCRKSPPWSMSA